MEINIRWSLLLFLCNILFFFIVVTSANFINFFMAHVHFHPLSAVLLLTILCFYLALTSLKNVKNITTLLISYIMMAITIIFAMFISFILLIGHLFS